MTKQEFEDKAFEMLKKCNDAVLTTVSEDGYPRSCVLGVIGRDSYKDIFFSTGLDGTKVRHLKTNPKASVCFFLAPDSVTLSGTAEVIDDLSEKERLWTEWMRPYFPNGVKDENFALIKFTGKTATFFIDGDFIRDEPIE